MKIDDLSNRSRILGNLLTAEVVMQYFRYFMIQGCLADVVHMVNNSLARVRSALNVVDLKEICLNSFQSLATDRLVILKN